MWGASGDVPVTGDFDGDGKTDVATFRPSAGIWYILRSSDGTPQQVTWGASGDVPVTGDFDGDGKTDVATSARARHLVHPSLQRRQAPAGDVGSAGRRARHRRLRWRRQD